MSHFLITIQADLIVPKMSGIHTWGRKDMLALILCALNISIFSPPNVWKQWQLFVQLFVSWLCLGRHRVWGCFLCMLSIRPAGQQKVLTNWSTGSVIISLYFLQIDYLPYHHGSTTRQFGFGGYSALWFWKWRRKVEIEVHAPGPWPTGMSWFTTCRDYHLTFETYWISIRNDQYKCKKTTQIWNGCRKSFNITNLIFPPFSQDFWAFRWRLAG